MANSFDSGNSGDVANNDFSADRLSAMIRQWGEGYRLNVRGGVAVHGMELFIERAPNWDGKRDRIFDAGLLSNFKELLSSGHFQLGPHILRLTGHLGV